MPDNWTPYIMVLALVMLIIHMWRGIAAGRESKNWPTVPGRVVASEVERETSRERVDRRDGVTRYRRKVSWIPRITYEYDVNGERFTGRNVYIFQMRYSQRRTAENVVRRYPKDKEVSVHYNPENPDKAVLQPGVPGRSQGVLFLFVVLLAAVLFSIFSDGISLGG